MEYTMWNNTGTPKLYRRLSDDKIGWFLNGQFISIDPTGHPEKVEDNNEHA
jgi:hypothetical protein